MQKQEINIIHFNDVYNIYDPNPVKQPHECPKAAAFVENILEFYDAHKDNTLIFFSGDFINPSLLSIQYKGQQMIKVFQQLPISAACIGNHEFDYKHEDFHSSNFMITNSTLSQFLYIMEQLDITWVLSNQPTFLSQVQKHYEQLELPQQSQKIQEYLIKDFCGIRIGIIGLIDNDFIQSLQDEYLKSVLQPEIIQPAKNLVRYLRNEQQCDLIIALTHMKISSDIQLQEKVQGIDMIFSGHMHFKLRIQSQSKKNIVIQSGQDFQCFTISKINYQTQQKSEVISHDSDLVEEEEKCAQEDDQQAVDNYIFEQETDQELIQAKQFFITKAISQMKTIDLNIEVIFKDIKPNLYNSSNHSQIYMDLVKYFVDIHKEFMKNGQKIIGYSNFEFNCMDKQIRSQEMGLGNFIVDAIRLTLNVNVAFFNSGGIRVNSEKELIQNQQFDKLESQSYQEFTKELIQVQTNLQEDLLKIKQQLMQEQQMIPIFEYQIASLLPFMDQIVSLLIKGKIIKQILQTSIQDIPHGRYLQVSGIQFSYKEIAYKNNNSIQKIVRILVEDSITILNKGPLKDEEDYFIAMPEYLALGNVGFDCMNQALKNKDAIIIKTPDFNITNLILNAFQQLVNLPFLKKKSQSQEPLYQNYSPKLLLERPLSTMQLESELLNKFYENNIIDANQCIISKIEGRVTKIIEEIFE